MQRAIDRQDASDILTADYWDLSPEFQLARIRALCDIEFTRGCIMPNSHSIDQAQRMLSYLRKRDVTMPWAALSAKGGVGLEWDDACMSVVFRNNGKINILRCGWAHQHGTTPTDVEVTNIQQCVDYVCAALDTAEPVPELAETEFSFGYMC